MRTGYGNAGVQICAEGSADCSYPGYWSWDEREGNSDWRRIEPFLYKTDFLMMPSPNG